MRYSYGYTHVLTFFGCRDMIESMWILLDVRRVKFKDGGHKPEVDIAKLISQLVDKMATCSYFSSVNLFLQLENGSSGTGSCYNSTTV